MKESILWSKIQMFFTVIGGWIGYFLGGMDGMLIALILFMVIDYITGVMCAIVDKDLSSEAGFKGIFKKCLIILLVGVANLIDTNVLQSGSVIRGAVIAFYLSNEGVSILENSARLGLPVPEKLKEILSQIHNKEEEEDESNE